MGNGNCWSSCADSPCCCDGRRVHYQSHTNPSSFRIRQLEEALVEVTSERDDALNRLSAAMAARLALNNPKIADLSDVNRPTKIGERYSELYDNQWTDALSALTANGLDEKSAIKTLLDVLIMIYDICARDAESQIEALDRFGVKDLPPEVMKTLIDKRKEKYKEYITEKRENVKKRVYKESKNCRRDKTMDKYMELCFELCWLMSIQDPPMIIDTHKDSHGSKFPKEYRAFTTSGNFLDYEVWPTLYLHTDGQVVTKGVAQGMAGKGEKSGLCFHDL